jgi:ribulose-bisphosphate carboxylase large chain
MRQAYECWRAGADPLEWAKDHPEFARALDSFPNDAEALRRTSLSVA